MMKRLMILTALMTGACSAALGQSAPPPAATRVVEEADASLEERLHALKEQAEKGDLHAAQQVYLRYALAHKPDEARVWAARYTELLTKKAEGGDSAAMLQLGARYVGGADYTPQDIQQATTWFSRAAEAGEPAGAYMLGEIYSRAGNVPMARQAYTKAFELYTARLEKDAGNLEALYWLGFMQQNGQGTKQDASAGLAKLEQACEAGSAWAAAQLFKTYYNGIGVPPDKPRAISYARKMADDHHDGTMAYIVARAYLQGEDAQQDIELGERYLDQAARANEPDAIYAKARRLEAAGKAEEALPYYRRAAGMQQCDALVRLGSMMLHGSPVLEQDAERGLALLERAGNRFESPAAALELARYYETLDEQATADSWYIAASNRGVPEAMARRGLLHLIPGSAATWDPTRAWQWWRTGERAGDKTCALYTTLFLYVFTPLLLIIAFGLPVFIGRRYGRTK